MSDRWGIAEKTVVITGASDGIGAAATRELSAQGANLVAVGRSAEKLARVAEGVRTQTGRDLRTHSVDFTALDEVRKLAHDLLEELPQIHVLVNNAGGIWPQRVVTGDGHEQTFQVNHLAVHLLTALLHDRLVASAPARIITTDSGAHNTGRLELTDLETERRRYRSMQVYGTTKLQNILFTRELGRRLAGSGVLAASLHPGAVSTGWGRDNWFTTFTTHFPVRNFFRTPEQGADTLVWLATAPTDEIETGGYYFNRRPGKLSRAAQDDQLATKLWDQTADLVGVPR